MQSTAHNFKENIKVAVKDENLRRALNNLKPGFRGRRAATVAKLPEWEELRNWGRDIKNHTLDNLDFYLETFESNVTANGGHVHWARTASEANEAVAAICRRVGAKTVTKGKSMVTEEIGLNAHLEAEGLEMIETDLGEYIIQLRGETPSHIIAPAIHLNKEDVAETFRKHHGPEQGFAENRQLDAVQDFTDEARSVLRQKFLAADVGITGSNFCIAETGTTTIVTNEGNGDLTQNLPRVHIVVTSIEKMVPTLEDVSTIIRLLARSATGQEISTYTTFSSGPKRPGDLDGPEEFHVVLVDNGRSAMIGTPAQEALRCIRCSACMNHCPVFESIGGHAYGWVVPGPIGAALDPALIGIEEAHHLPNASTFCGKCAEVCPMKIPLPKIMRHWRVEGFKAGTMSGPAKTALKLWAFAAKRPKLYRFGTWIAMRLLGRAGSVRGGSFESVPMAGGWTSVRDLPAPEGPTFQTLYRAGKKGV